MRAGILVALMLLLIAGDLSLSPAQGPQLQVGEVREIHAPPEHIWSLSWSPDGSRIAFTRHPFVQNVTTAHIWMVDASGANPRQVTQTPAGVRNWVPSLSPDGSRIAFYRCIQGPCALMVMSADGTGERTLATPDISATMPTWSPDGTRILFIGYRGNNPDVYVINVDGSALTPLVATPDDETRAVFSPDGRKLLYVASGQLRLADADGQNGRLVTLGPRDSDPRFSPDGQWIVYASRKREPFSYLRAIRVSEVLDGLVEDNRHILLTQGPNLWDYFPVFAPDGKRLAFLRQQQTGGVWQRGTLWLMTLR